MTPEGKRAAIRAEVLRRRQELAWLLGLCGVRCSHLLVCDEPAGHPPIAPPHWMHSETIGGPLGDLNEQLS